MARILIALPLEDFDPTESAIPWKRLAEAGHEVVFATEDGRPGACDPLLLTRPVFPQLAARPAAREAYREMAASPEFLAPARFAAVDPSGVDLMVLPGGHARGMRPYLESRALQDLVLAVRARARPVAAVCHGVLVLARTRDPATGRSVVHGRRVTALPAHFELGAWALTAWWLGNYYRTYRETVQSEVTRAVGIGGSFDPGPFLPRHDQGFVVEDGPLLTARWPGDVEAFAAAILRRLG